jgi:hypothetical protein
VTTTSPSQAAGGTPASEAVARPRRSRLWWPVAAGALVALLGIGLSVLLVLRPDLGSGGRQPAAVGDPVRTGFGSFTVTGVSTTFVPNTQGPPTSAQHAGTTGSEQLQVRVRLTNNRWKRGVTPLGEFRLIGDGSAAPRRPSGSTLTSAGLPQGATIDGQVWFDAVEGASTAGTEWLEYRAPDGQRVRVVVRQAATAPRQPRPSPSGQHGH